MWKVDSRRFGPTAFSEGLETWTPSPDAAPTSLDICAFVAAPSATAIDAGEFQIIVGPNLGAFAAGRNLGRFADLLGPEAEAALDRIARAESERIPDRLRAELVYLPQDYRLANLAVRPAMRSHEIIFGTNAGVSPSEVIPLNELVVGIRNGRFYVRWLVEDVEVIACAGHMLNSRVAAPAAFRFLEDISRDGQAQLNLFDWGTAADFLFLPRVQAGRIVLSLARWRIDNLTRASELPSESPKAFRAALARWRERWLVPQHVYLSFGDNRLLLDLEDAAQVEELRAKVHRLQEADDVLLQEALPAPEQAWTEGPDGHFATELVVPLVLRDAPAQTSRVISGFPASIGGVTTKSRLRPPGSDWLFVKLYCPHVFEEDLIAVPMRTFCEYVRTAGLAEGWFFIRYSDPDPHLRLRFRGDPDCLIGQLLPQLCSWAADLMSDELLYRLCFDTYDREVERYGGVAGTAAAEELFAADSRAVAELLYLSQQRLLEMDQTTLAILGIDNLLASLGVAEADRLRWYRDQVVSRHETGPEYRQRKKILRSLLGAPQQLLAQPSGEAVARIFDERRAALEPVTRRLEELTKQGKPGQPRTKLYQSFVHMHCNRLLRSDWSTEQQLIGLLLRTHEGLDRAPLQHPGKM